MQIKKNTVVSIIYELLDSSGNTLEKSDSSISYLHGGYDGIFPMVEEKLHNMEKDYTCSILMEPENTFGEYNKKLVRSELRNSFPPDLIIGMQFEGGKEGSSNNLIYTVTSITKDEVIVDGNHKLAGMTLRFNCTVTDVRPATKEELSHGHVHGLHDQEH
ncbi:MAG: peptidylprolyl isomerase [Nitrosospira sp.]|nr:peptidylprolyl isomerase [Nitrosospira sp.]